MVEAADFNLTAGRFKPQIGERVPDEDPVELIKESLAIEREIADGLEKLLKEIEL
jgi:type I restriction enzyme M protein